ncbi:MAG: MlaC/ttg2D family ABC transporter substrate-binding protein [Shimia sp.]
MAPFLTLTRRSFLGGALAGVAALAAPAAFALSTGEARGLVDALVRDINAVIASGKGEAGMIADFERIFTRYADVDRIAIAALGPAARSATAAERDAYITAFRGYIARKYGRQFRDFIGGRIEVQGARAIGSNRYEVTTTALLRGEAPFPVAFRVSDGSGRDLFYDMLVEGVSLLATEAQEVRALLDRNRGSIPNLTQALSRAG